MNKTTKTVGAGIATVATIALTTGVAHADDSTNIIKIGKYGELSASHKIAWIKLKVICPDETTSAYLEATLTQVTHGQVQPSTGSVNSSSAFECTGEEEVVYVPVRRPTGGFSWVKGAARVSDVYFQTTDPTGTHDDSAQGRTIYLR